MTEPSLPPFARFLSHAAACRWSMAAVGLHVALSATPLGGMPCPLLSLTGVPCPGCGVTRASEALAAGEWLRAVELHALAPIVLVLLGLVLASAVVNSSARNRLVALVARVEGRSKIAHVLLTAVVFYWLGRLALLGTAYAAAG